MIGIVLVVLLCEIVIGLMVLCEGVSFFYCCVLYIVDGKIVELVLVWFFKVFIVIVVFGVVVVVSFVV